MFARRFLIRGRVQGVGFRQYALQSATELELVGEVWNRRDGSVECVAMGTEEALDAFEEALRCGPGHVANVLAATAEPREADCFTIGPTK